MRDLPVKHIIVRSGFTTYDEAFDFAAKIAGRKRKEGWRGCVRIKFRKSTRTFEVQKPVPLSIPAVHEHYAKLPKGDA